MQTWHDPLVTPNEDQRPDGWSRGAASYEDVFAPFTERGLEVELPTQLPPWARLGVPDSLTALVGTGIAP